MFVLVTSRKIINYNIGIFYVEILLKYNLINNNMQVHISVLDLLLPSSKSKY